MKSIWLKPFIKLHGGYNDTCKWMVRTMVGHSTNNNLKHFGDAPNQPHFCHRRICLLATLWRNIHMNLFSYDFPDCENFMKIYSYVVFRYALTHTNKQKTYENISSVGCNNDATIMWTSQNISCLFKIPMVTKWAAFGLLQYCQYHVNYRWDALYLSSYNFARRILPVHSEERIW